MRGQKPDCIPWLADIYYYISGNAFLGKAKAEWQTEIGHVKLAAELGTVPYYVYDHAMAYSVEYNDKIVYETVTEGHTKTKAWKTPAGNLLGREIFSPDSLSSAPVKYPVENGNDLKALICLLEHQHLIPANLDTYASRAEMFKKHGGVAPVFMPRSPLSAFMVEWAGVENGVLLIMDYPELVERVLELFEQLEQHIIDAVCKLQPELVHFTDNLTSDVYTGFFEQYMSDRYKRRLARLHDVGIPCAVHLDGMVRGMLPKLAGVCVDAIEALTPKPVGDVAIENMRELAGSQKVVLWGGVPGAMFAPPFSWSDMKKHVLKLLDIWKDSRFVVGVADQIPPNGDLGFCNKIAKLIRDWEVQQK